MTLHDVFDAAAEIGFEVVLLEDRIANAEAELVSWAAARGVELEDSARVVSRPLFDDGLWVSVLRVKDRPTISVHRSQTRRPR